MSVVRRQSGCAGEVGRPYWRKDNDTIDQRAADTIAAISESLGYSAGTVSCRFIGMSMNAGVFDADRPVGRIAKAQEIVAEYYRKGSEGLDFSPSESLSETLRAVVERLSPRALPGPRPYDPERDAKHDCPLRPLPV
jgi:hypothetical protein